ncbi:hypothetical protein [Pediococcus acidilactici]|nr:hypothetical protein [Pediococcus acidilactici]
MIQQNIDISPTPKLNQALYETQKILEQPQKKINRLTMVSMPI